jgi:hypothetical protein
MPCSCGEVATRTLVAAPCSIVLNVNLPAALRSARASGVMCRERLVWIAPGWTALAVMPSPAQRRVASTANKMLAVLDCP